VTPKAHFFSGKSGGLKSEQHEISLKEQETEK